VTWPCPHEKARAVCPDCGATVSAASSVSAEAGQVPADTIEQARRAIERFVLCSDTRLRDGMSPDQRLAYQGLLAALAAVRTPEEQT
jgi:hypothetical protein